MVCNEVTGGDPLVSTFELSDFQMKFNEVKPNVSLRFYLR